MKIKYTRHARGRMRLYKINHEDIKKVIENPDITYQENVYTISICKLSDNFKGFPLKVIYTIENEYIIIISTYQLKKFHRR